MQVEEIESSVEIWPLKFPLRDTPHATIETNRNCNIRCRNCYNLDRSYIKTLNEVKKEIDLAIKKRNLQTITLLGGEPTLHPDITEIISYVKSKRLICQLLTNGIVLMQDKNGTFLDSLIRSGLDRILLHIDIGQNHIHKNIDESCHELFSNFERKKVHFALSITIYNDNKCMIPTFVRKYSKYKFFDGVLAVLEGDPMTLNLETIELSDEYKSISNGLIVEPTTYIPSSLDDSYVSWLVYCYYINAHTGKTFSILPIFYTIYRKLFRVVKGHHAFAIILNPSLYPFAILITFLIQTMIRPKRIMTFLRLLKNSSMTRSIRLQSITIQNPEIQLQENRLQMCYHCPDATIRNGMLTPVCLADLVNPLTNDSPHSIREDLHELVYRHLEEI